MEQRGRRPGGEEGRRGHGRWLMTGLLLRPAGGGMRGERDKLPRARACRLDGPFPLCRWAGGLGASARGPSWARRLTEEGRAGRLFLSGPP